eukprot:c22425_g2_i1 orf=177-1805(+)
MEEVKVEEKREESTVEVIEGGSKDEGAKEEVVVAGEASHEEAEEKGAEEEVETEDKPEGLPPSESLTEDTPSFKEESYSVGDLKEAEKKALEAFRLKVEEAIKSKTIFKKPKKIEEKVVAETPVLTETEPPVPAGTEPPVSAETEPPVLAETESPVPAAAETEIPTLPAVLEETPPPPCVDEPAADVAFAEKREILVEEPPVPPVEEGPKNFYLWGIPIHEGDDKTDVVLLKFLRARNFKADDALSMLKSTIKWRKEFEADIIEEEDVEGKEEFERWAFLQGVDKEGHPVCYNRNVFQSRDVTEKAKFGKFLRWRVQMMEKSIKNHLDFSPGGVHSFVQVIDLQNSPGLLKGAQAVKKFVSLLQDNYPEMAAKQIVINTPWWYVPALYRVFRLEPKVVWAGPGKSTGTLFKYIAPDQVPVQYGGLGRPNDTDFEGVEAPIMQLTVKAGEKQQIELPIEEVGTTLIWDVSVMGWDVVYGEEFVPSTYTVIIQKPQKLSPSTEPIRNSYKATETGKVVISIDNSVSKKKKTVVYRSTIKSTIVE